MGRTTAIFLTTVALAGCQVVPEAPRPLQPLPADGPAMTYREIIHRARSQATLATESFYIDQWQDVDRAAASLEDTARYLPKAIEVPVTQKASLEARSKTLAQEAKALREAVKGRDEKKTTDAMKKINLLVRELRPE